MYAVGIHGVGLRTVAHFMYAERRSLALVEPKPRIHQKEVVLEASLAPHMVTFHMAHSPVDDHSTISSPIVHENAWMRQKLYFGQLTEFINNNFTFACLWVRHPLPPGCLTNAKCTPPANNLTYRQANSWLGKPTPRKITFVSIPDVSLEASPCEAKSW